MAEIFPKWTNKIPLYLAGVAVLGAMIVPGLVWYFFSPEFTDVGYQPNQPVPFSHKLHAGDLQIDCRYCHVQVNISSVASVPPTQTCMNCHQLVGRDSEKLTVVMESVARNQPIRWVRVHKVPEYAYFNHSAHVNAGVGCSSCHGNVAEMEVVRQVEPLSMAWCLECHRNPDSHLREQNQITNTSWQPPPDHAEFVRQLKDRVDIDPPTDCTACHR